MRRRNPLAGATIAVGCGIALLAVARLPPETKAGTPVRASTTGNVLLRSGVAGRSAEGRPIGIRQLGDPALDGAVLIFGCIHGDGCAASGIEPSSDLRLRLDSSVVRFGQEVGKD